MIKKKRREEKKRKEKKRKEKHRVTSIVIGNTGFGFNQIRMLNMALSLMSE